MERIVARKLAKDLEDRNILPANPGGFTQGKCSCMCMWCVWRIPEERTNTGCGNLSRGRIEQVPVQAANGPALAIILWSQPDTDPVDYRSAPGKISCDAAWKLELCYSSAHNGHTTRLTTLASVLQFVHKGLAHLNAGRRRVHVQNNKGHPGDSRTCAWTTGNAFQWCQDTESLINPSKAQTLSYTLNNKATGKAMPVVTFDGALIERRSHMRYLWVDALRQNIDLQTPRGNNSIEVQEMPFFFFLS